MIITDSVGAPRKDIEIIHFNDTWPWNVFDYMMKNKKYYNFIYSQKALDSNELRRVVNLHLDLYDQEYIFLQIGIVDCARRVLSKSAIRIINMLPIIRNVIKYFANKYHLKFTKLYKITYTKPSLFYDNILFFLEKFKNAKRVYVIPIVPAGSKQKLKSYKIQEQIDLYNSLLSKATSEYKNAIFLASCIEPFLPINDSLYTSDGYHISKKGHLEIYNAIRLSFIND